MHIDKFHKQRCMKVSPRFLILSGNTVVSTSPRPFIEYLVALYEMPIKYIVGYHDAKPIKPHPASMIKALESMRIITEL